MKSWTKKQEKQLRKAWATATPMSELAGMFKRSPDAVACKAKRMGLKMDTRNDAIQLQGSAEPPPERGNVTTKSMDTEKGTGQAYLQTSERIKTAAEAMRKADIDPKEWQVTRQEFKSYEMFHKGPNDETVIVPLHAVRLALKRKNNWSPSEFLAQVVQELKAVPKTTSKAKRLKKGGLLAEVSIMDHHFGKLAWSPETGEDYDLRIAEDRYRAAADRLIESADANKADRILFVVGHDFYHVDKGNNTTTGGTPQDVDGRWQKAFSVGCKCVRDAINEARKVAPVDVAIVPGNHDEERTFTLGVVLSAIYEKDSRVTIDNSPDIKKAYLWGKTFIGLYHGQHSMNTAKEKAVIDALQSKYPSEWAAAVWRELHLGHIHHEREDVWKYRTSQDLDQVIVRRLPSLSGTDRWHHHQGYKSIKAAEVHFYCSQTGRVGYQVASNHSLKIGGAA